MAPILSHAPRREVDNFYQNSFKQLSSIQQKQVGLLVGAAVADAAARPLNGYTSAEVTAYVQRVQDEMTAFASSSLAAKLSPASSLAGDVVAFARVPVRGAEMTDTTDGTPSSSFVNATNSMRYHSFSYLLFFEVLRAIHASRGDVVFEQAQEQLVRVANAVHPTCVFEREHASLLHTLCCLLPTPSVYPYASDVALREFVEPFASFLTQTSTETRPTTLGSPTLPEEGISVAEATEAERAAVQDYTFSALGVVLRNLQTNPDSTRNGAFMAVPGTAAMFPPDVQPFVPELTSVDAGGALGKQRQHLWEIQQRLAACPVASSPTKSTAAAPRWLPIRSTAADAAVIRESLTIARGPVSFTKGVAQAIHLGGPTCQRAMLVGALLGAKLGVRYIPLEWLSATPDHQPVATMAMEVSQFVWNAPRH
jgi:hypothetical protein